MELKVKMNFKSEKEKVSSGFIKLRLEVCVGLL
jgi:hypothetical protein